MIAALEAAGAGLFKRDQWGRNIAAGVIVGVVALPLAMAFAIASGVKPEQGIYTAIVAGIAVSLFGGTRIQIAGPTGAFVVILAGVTAQYGVDGLLLATCMAGVILILLGAANFGGVLRFIPDPVIAGFTAGIGVIIWVSQWKDFFGLPAVSGTLFHEKLWHLLQAPARFASRHHCARAAQPAVGYLRTARAGPVARARSVDRNARRHRDPSDVSIRRRRHDRQRIRWNSRAVCRI